MIKTLGLTVLASCAIWATPANAQSASSQSPLEIKVRGNAAVAQEAQGGTLYVNGMIDADFDWDAFESELMEQTDVTTSDTENDLHSVYVELVETIDAHESTQILRYYVGSASNVLAADEYISGSDLSVFTSVNLSMDPTPDTERRAVVAATADARERAELVALSTGCRLDRLTSVELLRLETNGRPDGIILSLVSQDHAPQRSPQPTDAIPEAWLEASISATFIAHCP